MDRWDWVYLSIVTLLAMCDRITCEECEQEWDRLAPIDGDY
jgi:hypothetical protein